MMSKEQPTNPERLISWFDIARGVGEVALEFVTKQFLHESPSEHFPHDPLVTPIKPVTHLEVEG